MKKRLLTLALFCLSAMLCACSMPLQMSIEELLQPPQLSEAQTAVYDTLSDHVGQSIKLKYPASGEYRSAFIFHDIDADGQDEALVLYSVENSSAAWISILEHDENGWRVDKLLPGAGSGVDFLRFETMTNAGGENIAVGWSGETTEKQLVIYGLGGEGIEQLYSGEYSRIAIQDFNADSLCEIVIVLTSRTRPAVRLIGADGAEISVRSTVYLSSRITGFAEPKNGGIIGNINGIFLDCYMDDDTLCTAVVQIVGQKLTTLIGNDDEGIAATARPEAIFCADTDADGIIEIPRQSPAPGYQEAGDETIYLTRFAHYDPDAEDRLADETTAFISVASGYRFIFPASWQDESISLYRQKENGETMFFLYHGDIYDHGDELIRIRVNQTQDYQDKFDIQKYFTVGNRGAFEYYGCITVGEDDPLTISKEEFMSCFALIG